MDALQHVRHVPCRYIGEDAVGRLDEYVVLQLGYLLTIDYHFARRHLSHAYLRRWLHENTARRERDGVDHFGCLPQQVHADGSSASRVSHLLQRLGDV